MMKRLFCLLLLLPLCYGIRAQTVERQVVASSGGYHSSASGSVSYTIGEALTATLTNANGAATQGFQQPDTSGTSSLAQITPPSFSVTLFPNPVAANAYLKIETSATQRLTLRLYDAFGRQILLENYSAQSGMGQHELPLATYSDGIYFLTISTADGTEAQTIRIIKNQ